MRDRIVTWLGAIALIVLGLQASSSAAMPYFVMVYGPGLPEPIVMTLEPASREEVLASLYLWGKTSDGTAAIAQPPGRAYVNVAVFWGNTWKEYVDDPALGKRLQPGDANQHGRLFLPTRTEPAAIVVTGIRGAAFGQPSAADFSAGWLLSEEDTARARTVGIPGF